MEKSLRIAVCFHGQLRTGVESSKNLKHFFGDYFHSLDFFVHTWNINTTRMPLNLVGYEPPVYRIQEETHEAFKEIYRPINYYAEDQERYWNRVLETHGSTGDLVNLWHSGYHSNQFKKTYESANKFKYDYVVRLRPDCIFPPDRKFGDDLEEVIKDPSRYYNQHLFGDTYHVATSNVMDIAANFYIKGNFYGRHFWPMIDFEKYMNDHGIVVTRFKDNRATILRQEFKYLDPLNYYWQMNAANAMIFENINFSKDNLIYTYENLKNPNWRSDAKKNLETIFGNDETPRQYFNFYKDLP